MDRGARADAPDRRVAWRRVAVVLGVVVVSVLALVFFSRWRRASACEEWRRALDEATAEGAVAGGVEARSFREQAIRRGWVDLGERVVHRPDGCAP